MLNLLPLIVSKNSSITGELRLSLIPKFVNSEKLEVETSNWVLEVDNNEKLEVETSNRASARLVLPDMNGKKWRRT